MNTGQPAEGSGVPAKVPRSDEAAGLIAAAGRTEVGFRIYSDADVETLRFVRRARDLGLPIKRIRLLVRLWQDKDRSSGAGKRAALAPAVELRTKAAELTGMLKALEELADVCRGDHRPEYPILRDLWGGVRRQSPPDRGAVARRNTVRPHCIDADQGGRRTAA